MHAHSLPENHDADTPWRPPLTKILATVGPSISHPEVIQRMMENGARLFRLNFSHGTFDEHKSRHDMIRMVSKATRTSVAILGDLSGPKIRVTKVKPSGIVLKPGQDVIIRVDTPEAVDGPEPVLGATYSNVAREAAPGHRVLINDGDIRMLCVEKGKGEIRCRVTTGGLVTTGKGINLPDSELSVPALTEHDWRCVDWSVEHGLDFLALSFVRAPDDVKELRDYLTKVCTPETCGFGMRDRAECVIPIIAKIETPQAVERIKPILEHCDGIMVARGDLGVEMDVSTVPVSQKRLIKVAHEHGKPAIVATQMLESMIKSATPTRAEVSDVANAILDGSDCVMLSAETAIGRYPHVAVETMRRVACSTEAHWREEPPAAASPGIVHEASAIGAAVAHGAWHISQDVGAELIVVWSQRGSGARLLSRNNFNVPIIAFSSDLKAVRRMNLLYGVYPIWMQQVPEHRSDFARIVDRLVLERNLARRGDPMLLLGGKPLDAPGSLNTLAVRRAGDLVPSEEINEAPAEVLADANV